MKKLLVVLITTFFILFPNTVFADETTHLKVFSKIDKKNSDFVNIDINIENNPGVTAWMFEVEFDKDVFEYVDNSIIITDAFSNGTSLENVDNPGKVIISWFNFGDVDYNGKLLSFDLHIKDDAKTGDYEIKLKCDDADFVNFEEESLEVIVENYVIHISSNNNKDNDSLLKEHEVSINPDDIYNLKSNGKDLIWVSSDENIAVVEDGKIIPISEGSVVIEAHTKDGAKQDVCIVNINANNPTTFIKLVKNPIFILLLITVLVVVVLIVAILKRKRHRK